MPRRKDPLARWQEGEIEIYAHQTDYESTGTNEAGQETFKADRLKLTRVGSTYAKKFGDRLALPEPFEAEVIPLPGVVIDVRLRQGRAQAVAIRSEADGPELNQSVLRRIGGVEDHVREALRDFAYRLEVDEAGQVFGVVVGSDQEPMDRRTWDERTADVAERVAELVPRRGRPRLDDATMRRVAAIVTEARSLKQSTERAVMEAFPGLTFGAAKKRIRLAYERGYLKKEEKSA